MQRNDRLLTLILKTVAGEGKNRPGQPLATDFEGHQPETVAYHRRLLYDKGLVYGYASDNNNSSHKCLLDATIWGLTWAGHDYLDSLDSTKVNIAGKLFCPTTGTWQNFYKEVPIKDGLGD